MLYPARMKRVKIITHSDFIISLTEDLHRSGLMQIDPLEMEDLEQRSPDRSRLEGLLTRLDSIMEIIRYEEPVGIKEEILHPRPPEIFQISERTDDEIVAQVESILPGIEDEVERLEEKLGSLRERRSRFEDQRAELRALLGLPFELSLLGKGDYASIFAGTTRDPEALQEELDSELIHIFHSGSKGEYSLVIVVHNTEVPRVERARRQRLFDSVDIGGPKGTPREVFEEIETELLTIRGEVKDIEDKFHALYKEHRKELLILKEELNIFLDRFRVFENYRVTETTTSLTGWIEKGGEEELRSLCRDATQGNFAINFDDPEGEEAPVKMDNPRWAKPFETLVKMFSPPRYNEVDSSTIVGPLFIIFFGLMVGDAGYGIFILSLSLFAYFHIGKYSEEMRGYAYFGILMGISTIFFGLIMGGFYYDSLQKFVYGNGNAALYPSFSLLGMNFPIDPMNDPMSVFMISLYIGIITLNIGIALSAYQNYRNKDYHALINDNISWVFLEPGMIALIGTWMLGAFELSTTMTILAVTATIVGIILRVRVSGGLVLFDITGFAGNVLSFARILALGLATAGLALTINIFVELIGGIHPIFIIIALLFFIIVHFANTLLQSLGAGIHSLRLQYVELFSMFYKGGGKLFRPFRIERQWTQVIEREIRS